MSLTSVTVDLDQFKCPTCLDILDNPVTIPCGHSFCMDCIRITLDCDDEPTCPQCSTIFTTCPVLGKNVILAMMVDNIKRSRTADKDCDRQVGSKQKATDSLFLLESKARCVSKTLMDTVCSLHHRPLEVYCRTDSRSICPLCVMDQHQHHKTVSVVTETKRRQKQLTVKRRALQQKLQERERKLLKMRLTLESFRDSAWAAVENTDNIFTELIQFIERKYSEVKELIRNQEKATTDEAKSLLDHMEQEITEMKRIDSELEQLSGTKDPICFLQMWPLQYSPPEPGAPLNITVDQRLLFETISGAVSDLKRQLGDMCEAQINRITHKENESSSAPGTSSVPEQQCAPEPSSRPEFLQYAYQLTFDEDTANQELTLSAGGREVTRGPHKQRYTGYPERFSSKSQVLCKEVLSGSRFYWEVEVVGNKAEVAVTYRGICRKGTGLSASFGGNCHSWSLDCINGDYSASHDNKSINIMVPYCPRVGVYLDHRAGTLSFYSVSNRMTLLQRYQTTFHEPVYAGFWVGEGVTIKLCPLQQ